MVALPSLLGAGGAQALAGVAAALAVSAGLVASGAVSVIGSADGPSPAAAASQGKGGAGNGAGGGSENKTFTVSGAVDGLAPGIENVISLSLTNNGTQPIRIRRVTITAADVTDVAGSVRCPASMLRLGSGRTAGSGSVEPVDLVVAGNATAQSALAFPVRLAADATNGCKNVTWQLRYAGSAERA